MDIPKPLNLNAAATVLAGAQPSFVLISIEGGIWACAPVSESPQVVLTDWCIYEVQMLGRTARTRHFVGYNTTDCEGRVSSAIVTFDAAKQSGVTESGRVYELRGKSGNSGDADYTWSRWRAITGATNVLDVTAEIKLLIESKS